MPHHSPTLTCTHNSLFCTHTHVTLYTRTSPQQIISQHHSFQPSTHLKHNSQTKINNTQSTQQAHHLLIKLPHKRGNLLNSCVQRHNLIQLLTPPKSTHNTKLPKLHQNLLAKLIPTLHTYNKITSPSQTHSQSSNLPYVQITSIYTIPFTLRTPCTSTDNTI